MPTRPVQKIIEGKSFPAVTSTMSVRDAANMMKAYHQAAVLVVDREVLKGICTERDVVFDVVAEGLDPDRTTVEHVMTPDPQTITPDRPFVHALHIMYEGGFRHVPVVDADGHPVGIVTAHDALGLDALQFQKELVQREEITVIL